MYTTKKMVDWRVDRDIRETLSSSHPKDCKANNAVSMWFHVLQCHAHVPDVYMAQPEKACPRSLPDTQLCLELLYTVSC